MTVCKLCIHIDSFGAGLGAILRCSNISTVVTAMQREAQISVLYIDKILYPLLQKSTYILRPGV